MLRVLASMVLAMTVAPAAPAWAEPLAAPLAIEPSMSPPGRRRLRALWAGPDAPRIALELEVDASQIVIGHFGGWLPIAGVDAGDGWFVGLSPQLEVEGAPIPYQYWRGRIAAEAGSSRSMVWGGRRVQLDLSAGVMHESDHVTYVHPDAGFVPPSPPVVVVNDVFGRATARTPVAHWDVATTLTPRFHVLTCTADDLFCGTGVDGDVTIGAGLDVVAFSLRPGLLGLSPFASARAEGHLAHGRARSEWRMALRGGWVSLYGPQGAWQFALEVRLGHPVGIFRGVDSSAGRLLLSLGWCP